MLCHIVLLLISTDVNVKQKNICVNHCHRRFVVVQGEQTTDSNNNLSDWWNFQWETYMSALFHPMASLTRPMARQDDLEVRRV